MINFDDQHVKQRPVIIILNLCETLCVSKSNSQSALRFPSIRQVVVWITRARKFRRVKTLTSCCLCPVRFLWYPLIILQLSSLITIVVNIAAANALYISQYYFFKPGKGEFSLTFFLNAKRYIALLFPVAVELVLFFLINFSSNNPCSIKA